MNRVTLVTLAERAERTLYWLAIPNEQINQEIALLRAAAACVKGLEAYDESHYAAELLADYRRATEGKP